jgi:hypothetical protein
LDLFAQYALQYLLHDQQPAAEQVESLTWYNLANQSVRSRNRLYIDDCWKKMQRLMNTDFDVLQCALRTRGFKGLRGGPDLFCWNRTDRTWFVAEAKAKGRDRVKKNQRAWEAVYCEVLPTAPEIRLYELEPAARHPLEPTARA